jgi:hypothetical protein
MAMDGDFYINIEETFQRISSAEVITVFFPRLGKTLLVDVRIDSDTDPLVQVVQKADGPEDRIRRLQRMRPQFPRPDAVAMIVWSHQLSSLERCGVIEQIRDRLVLTDRLNVVTQLDESLKMIAELERAEIVKAITGDQYHTLWSASEE